MGSQQKKQLLDSVLRGYWEVRSWLTHPDDIIYLDQWIVIPQKMRKQVLEHLQSAHQDITSMKARANNCVYWPEISRSIKNYRYSCTAYDPLISPIPQSQANKNHTIFSVALSTNMCWLFCNAFIQVPNYCSSLQWMDHHLLFQTGGCQHLIFWKDLHRAVHYFWGPWRA